jgi:hypothetical protein
MRSLRLVALVALAGLALPTWACGNGSKAVDEARATGGTAEGDAGAGGGIHRVGDEGSIGPGARDAAATAAGEGGAVEDDGGRAGLADAAPGDAGVALDAIGKGAAIDPFLVGQNAWTRAALASSGPLVQASGVRLIRVGGIEWNDTPPTEAEYLQMVSQIRAIGAEPLLQVSRSASAVQAEALVTALNVTKGQNVRFWSIGNEPEQNQLSPAAVATYVRTLASAMKKADPSIQIFAPETAWYNDAILGPLLGGANDITGRDGSGRYYIDGVSFHAYPNPTYLNQFNRGTVTASGDGLRNSVANLKAKLDAANVKNGRTGSARLQWALTEFNVTWKNPTNNGVGDYAVTSFLNGQFFAEVFGIAMEYGARFAIPWNIHEDGSRGTFDLGYLDGVAAVKNPRSSYWHMQLVATHFRGRFAAGRTNRPLVKAFGAGDGTKLAVMVLNEETTQTYRFTLHLGNASAPSADPLDIHIDSALSRDVTGTIDAQATAVFLFDGQGTLTKRLDYRLGDALAWMPPH